MEVRMSTQQAQRQSQMTASAQVLLMHCQCIYMLLQQPQDQLTPHRSQPRNVSSSRLVLPRSTAALQRGQGHARSRTGLPAAVASRQLSRRWLQP